MQSIPKYNNPSSPIPEKLVGIGQLPSQDKQARSCKMVTRITLN